MPAPDLSWLPGAIPGAARARHVEAYADEGWQQNPSGLYVPALARRRRSRPVAIDLFAGAGGFSLGIIQAGFQVVAALDADVDAAITYTVNLGAFPMQFHYAAKEDEERLEKKLKKSLKKNENGVYYMSQTAGSGWRQHHPEHPGVEHFFLGDVRQFTGQQILDAISMDVGEVDLVCGGPPCQGFSTAGKRDVMDPRNSLVFEFARLVLEIMPKTIVLENVPGILNMSTPEGLPVVEVFIKMLSEGGFSTYEALKKSLLHNLDARAAVRKKGGSVEAESPHVEAEPEPAQLSLFG